MGNEQVTYRSILKIWSPMAATWLMMAIEGPLLVAVIARLADPEMNLAAFRVAFSFALFIEAPVIMLLSAGTALVKSSESFAKLFKFGNIMIGAVTLFGGFLLIPPVFNVLAVSVMDLPTDIEQLAHQALFALWLWPAAVGYRRMYQGVMIRFGQTMPIAYGTVLRFLTIGVVAFGLKAWTQLDGSLVATLSMSVAVFVEAIASRVMAIPTLRKLEGITPTQDCREMSTRSIWEFYRPLALMTMIALGIHPLINGVIGYAHLPVASLAVLPAVDGLTFMFRALGLSYQEVAIALFDKGQEAVQKLTKFAIWLGVCASAGLAIVAFTPLYDIWFSSVYKLTPELTEFSKLPLQLLVLLPLLSVILSYQRAIYVNNRDTGPITWATVFEAASIVVVIGGVAMFTSISGAIATSVALLGGRLLANIYLGRPAVKHMA